jgi:hypothetical protein
MPTGTPHGYAIIFIPPDCETAMHFSHMAGTGKRRSTVFLWLSREDWQFFRPLYFQLLRLVFTSPASNFSRSRPGLCSGPDVGKTETHSRVRDPLAGTGQPVD